LYPADTSGYALFLFAFFVLACGMNLLQVAANHNAGCSIALIVTAIHAGGALAFWAIIAVGLCNSIMFPVIFSMALHKLGPLTGRGSGLLCMAIVGGAVIPFGQGFLADAVGVQHSFWVPAACYAYLLFFGIRFAGLYKDD
jgi:FHS family L-fucose permease-like MFS transporter